MPLRFQPNRGSAIILIAQTLYSLRQTVIDGWTTVSSTPFNVLTTHVRLWVSINPCTIVFPLSSALSHDVMIKDGAGGAFTNNIHTSYTAGQTCDAQADVKITSNYGFIIIGPRPTGGGYTKTG